MLADPISTNNPTGGTVAWTRLADGSRIGNLVHPNLASPATMAIRHTNVARNVKKGIKAARRSNVNVVAPLIDTVTGSVDPYTINITVNNTNLDSDALKSTLPAILLAMAAQLIDPTDAPRRDGFLQGQA